jgi:phage terminase large subunit-like protein
VKRFKQYIDFVREEKDKTGLFIKLAIDRHLNDIGQSTKPSYPYYFDNELASKYIRLFEVFRHWKGEWADKRITLEPHQVFYLASLAGWRQKGTKYRRYKNAFKEVARKNGKTTECAGKAIIHLLLDKEPGAQVYAAATKEDQAIIVVNDAGKIILQTPELKEYFDTYVYRGKIHRIVKRDLSGFMAALGRDSKTQDGLDPSYGIIDEYHAHVTDELVNVIESGMGSRRQRMIDIITTAGFNKQHPCYSITRKKAINVLKGIVQEDDFFTMLFELDKEDDWENKETWIKANPNLGSSVKMEYLKSRFESAKNEGGSKEVDFKTKNLNQWTDSEVTWIPDDVWMSTVEKFSIEDLYGYECNIGLDLASTRDTTCLMLLFDKAGKYFIYPFFYVPELSAKVRSKKDGVNYDTWIKQGYIIETPGNVTDYDYIRKTLLDLKDKIKIKSISYDSWNTSQFIPKLIDDGFKCNPFGQGMSIMSAPTKELEKLIYQKRIIHTGNPVMRWQMSNVLILRDANDNYKINKEKSKEKVDGAVALVMAYGDYLTSSPGGPSVYEERGILKL